MKHLKVLLTMTIALFFLASIDAQTTKVKKKDNVAVTDSVYQYPMKCEGDYTYNKEGKCQVCKMKLKSITKPTPIAFRCPMNCEGEKTYSKETNCPVCNMALKK